MAVSASSIGRSISSSSISYSPLLGFVKRNYNQHNQINYGFNTKYSSLVINCSDSENGHSSDAVAFSLNENGTSRGPVKWQRVLLKVSGEALAGDGEQNIDPKVTMAIAREVAEVTRLGIEVAIVVGGGNIFHGASWAGSSGLDRSSADYIGFNFNHISTRQNLAGKFSDMGSSINTLSLHYPTVIHAHPQFKKHLQSSLHFDQILKISPKPISTISYLNKPTSYYPLITSSSSTHKEFTNFMSEKIVTLLVGSFIFMGIFNKHVLAQPSHSQTQSQSTESQSSDFDEEETMYMKLLEGNPKDVEILKSVFHGKMKRGKTKEAIEYVERLIAIEPKEVEWRLLQALCYEMIGDYNKAKNLFKNILKERPLLFRALHGLAMVMHKNLEGLAIFEMLNKSLEIARQTKKVTDERNIRILIAQMHVVKGELDYALKLFQDLINENPRDFRPYLCQGIIYSLLDRKEEAEEQFLTYQSLVPDEFPQRGFLDDVVLAAKTEIRQKNKKGLKPEFLYKK